MIDYDTILSTTEDKMTLLQWLKKVEAALKDASATSFKVNKKGDATLTFSIVFADGTELESGEIILQQGESVESAAIVNGHLILTLTNGDELDAGAILNGDLNVTGSVTATGNITTGGKFVGVTEFEKIKDAQGHNRFIEGDLSITETEGITITYAKWSLSGTHLMLVIAGSAANGTTLPWTEVFASTGNTLPAWVFDKIYPTYAATFVETKEIKAYNNSGATQNMVMHLRKGSNSVYLTLQNIEFTDDRYFRAQFDLLIDND